MNFIAFEGLYSVLVWFRKYIHIVSVI